MTDAELIARQAKEIAMATDLLQAYRDAAESVRSKIYCIGGPLNDNKLQYTNGQLVIFTEIVQDLDIEDL